MLHKWATAAVTMEILEWDQKNHCISGKTTESCCPVLFVLTCGLLRGEKGEYSHSCSSDQNPAGGEDPRGPVHQPLQLHQLHHQPRVWLQRHHLLVCLLCRLHQQELSGTNRPIWIQHHSGPCDPDLVILLQTLPCFLKLCTRFHRSS